MTKTLDGTVTSWNPAAEKLFGYTADEAVGRNITFIIPKEHRHEETMVLAKIRRGESSILRDDPHAQGRNDVSRIAHDLARPRRGRNHRRRFEDRPRHRRPDANRRRAHGDPRARAGGPRGRRGRESRQDEFLAILSHELRTPLNAVYGWARMMQTAKLDEETSARALDAIVRNANAQVQLIDDLLDVSRVINGKMRLEVRPVDVQEVIDAALDAVGSAAETKGVESRARDRSARGGGGRRSGPAPAGDLEPRHERREVHPVGRARPGSPAPRDRPRRARSERHGAGIPAHVLPYVFDRFRQWDSSSTRAHSGLGLGLASSNISRSCTTAPFRRRAPVKGRGRRFGSCSRSPSRRGCSRPSPAAPGITLGAPVRLDGLRILAVDDDADALELAATIPSDGGATVKTCRSAVAAYTLLQEWRPDILVSDIDMPGRTVTPSSGRSGPWTRPGSKTPAVALTAYGRTEDRVQTLSSGYSMHIPKPVDPRRIYDDHRQCCPRPSVAESARLIPSGFSVGPARANEVIIMAKKVADLAAYRRKRNFSVTTEPGEDAPRVHAST